MTIQAEIANALHSAYGQITSNLQVDVRESIKIGKVELVDYAAEIKHQFIDVYGTRGDKVEVTANYNPQISKIEILVRNAPIPTVSQHLKDEDGDTYDTITGIGVYLSDSEQLPQLDMKEVLMSSNLRRAIENFHADLSSDSLHSLLHAKSQFSDSVSMLTRLLGWTQPPDNGELQQDVELLLKIMLLDNFRDCLETDDPLDWHRHIKTGSLHRVGCYQPDILLTIDVENLEDADSYQAYYVAKAVIDGERQLFNIGFPYNVYSSSRRICKGRIQYNNSPSFVAQWLTGICNYDLCDPFQQTAFLVLDALFRAGVFDSSSTANSLCRMNAIVDLLNEWGDDMDASSIRCPTRIFVEPPCAIDINPNAVICPKKEAPSFLDGKGDLCFGTGFIMDNRRFFAFADGKRQWIFDTDGTYLTQAPIDFEFNHHGI